MKKVFLVIMLVLCGFMFVGCDSSSDNDADVKMQSQTSQAMAEAYSQVGPPAIVNWQELRLAKMIYELRDQENLICYAYLKNLDGYPVYLGQCIGYGLPYAVQFSNPERIVDYRSMLGLGRMVDRQLGTLPQPEPNGLFMPQSLSATWLMMIDPDTGMPRPVYIEPEIIVSPFPLPYARGFQR